MKLSISRDDGAGIIGFLMVFSCILTHGFAKKVSIWLVLCGHLLSTENTPVVLDTARIPEG